MISLHIDRVYVSREKIEVHRYSIHMKEIYTSCRKKRVSECSEQLSAQSIARKRGKQVAQASSTVRDRKRSDRIVEECAQTTQISIHALQVKNALIQAIFRSWDEARRRRIKSCTRRVGSREGFCRARARDARLPFS